MLQSDTSTEGNDEFPFSYFATVEQDEIFEEGIDTFDEQMDNEYDDGIAQSDVDHLEDESEDEDDLGEDEDNIRPFAINDEFADYDELEE